MNKIMKNEIVIYQPDDLSTRIDVRIEDETVWLNRQQIATLFGRDVKTIGKHINNALKEELQGFSTVANFATVQNEGELKSNMCFLCIPLGKLDITICDVKANSLKSQIATSKTEKYYYE